MDAIQKKYCTLKHFMTVNDENMTIITFVRHKKEHAAFVKH